MGVALWDLAFGGINDDAFSQMLLTDLIASASRVYGAFLLAAAVALPLGMLIGRLRIGARTAGTHASSFCAPSRSPPGCRCR